MPLIKKSLDKILSKFKQAHAELEEFEELSAVEQKEAEQRLQDIKSSRQRASKARDALKDMLGL